jgi:hypothetical protein
VKIGGLVSRFRDWWRRRRGTPFTPSDRERFLLSEHLFYDIQMTFVLADVLMGMLQNPAPSPLDDLVRSALLESFLARCRSCVEFFWHDRRKWEDALAADYFAPGEWKKMRPNRPHRLNRVVTQKVGWGGMHLTYPRARTTGKPKEKEWEPIRMCAALEPAVRLFIDRVDSTQFDPAWFPHIRPVLDGFKAKYGSVTP